MARLPRFFVPGVPLHVVQRGNNRAAIFEGADDFAFFYGCLLYSARRYGALIHAYVLMTNHVHLVVTPSATSSVPRMMQSVGRVYVAYFNRLHARTGTLWEGRYKAAIIDDESYLISCMRYVELNPVRAGMVSSPELYRWSSFRCNALGAVDHLVTAHALYQRTGSTPEERQREYTKLFGTFIDEKSMAAIREATQYGWALGDPAFKAKVSVLARRSERIRRGPRRTATTTVIRL